MDIGFQKTRQHQLLQHRTEPRRWLVSPGDEDEHPGCNEFVARNSLRVPDLKSEQVTRSKHHLHHDEEQKRVKEEEMKHTTLVSGGGQIGTSRYENDKSLESNSLESRVSISISNNNNNNNNNNDDEDYPNKIRTVTSNSFTLHKSNSDNQYLYHDATLYTSRFETIRHQQCNSQRDQFTYQPLCNLKSSSLRQIMSQKRHQSYSITADLPQKLLIILIMNAIFNHLSQSLMHLHTTTDKQQHHRLQSLGYPTAVISASALTTAALAAETTVECRSDSDCEETDRICHDNKCMCRRNRPIEDKGVCLALAIIGEECSVSQQCLGNSVCIENYCSCSADSISLYNPSAKIYYCHPKRRLYGECSHDAQCPSNSFCSNKLGCLCQNGHGPVTVAQPDGVESIECLPKRCSFTRDCESEYHVCEDNECLCLATHFDPHTAECYKFGSTGGKLSGNQTSTSADSSNTKDADKDKGFTSIFKDLMENSDKLWYVIIILAALTLLLLTLMIMIVRKYYLGYCWTAHKKEYEPNNAPKGAGGGHFDKNSINNKSFRRKNGEADEENDHEDNNDDTAADRSNLVTTTVSKNRSVLVDGKQQRPSPSVGTKKASASDTENRYVKVNMRGTSADAHSGEDYDGQQQADSTNGHYQPYQQLSSRPLSTSNSTAV